MTARYYDDEMYEDRLASFRDDFDEPFPERTCADCYWSTGCSLEDHEDVVWCGRYNDFNLASEPSCGEFA